MSENLSFKHVFCRWPRSLRRIRVCHPFVDLDLNCYAIRRHGTSRCVGCQGTPATVDNDDNCGMSLLIIAVI